MSPSASVRKRKTLLVPRPSGLSHDKNQNKCKWIFLRSYGGMRRPDYGKRARCQLSSARAGHAGGSPVRCYGTDAFYVTTRHVVPANWGSAFGAHLPRVERGGILGSLFRFSFVALGSAVPAVRRCRSKRNLPPPRTSTQQSQRARTAADCRRDISHSAGRLPQVARRCASVLRLGETPKQI